MKRGDIYTAATGHGFGGKPRPVLVLQADAFCDLSKIIVALIGSPVEAAEGIRVRVAPDEDNGLLAPSDVQVDTILPVRTGNFGRHVGTLSNADMRNVERALLVFLGFAQ